MAMDMFLCEQADKSESVVCVDSGVCGGVGVRDVKGDSEALVRCVMLTICTLLGAV
jgi:hypothetical protein